MQSLSSQLDVFIIVYKTPKYTKKGEIKWEFHPSKAFPMQIGAEAKIYNINKRRDRIGVIYALIGNLLSIRRTAHSK